MAAVKQQQQGVVAATAEPSVAWRLWRVVRAVLYMLRRGLPSGRKLTMDLHLLLHRGKIAGKALGELFLTFHHGRHSAAAFPYAEGAGAGAGVGPFSCRALDPSLAVHEPTLRAREYSCSNTPSSASGGGGLGLLRRRGRRSRQSHRGEPATGGYLQCYGGYDAAEVARVFEMLSDDGGADEPGAVTAVSASASATPSPAQLLYWAVARSPYAGTRQTPFVGGSPSPADGAGAQQVDRQADEFIRRFYEQLRAQRSAASTPDYYGHAAAASPYAAGATTNPRAPWAVTAGIA